MRPSRLLSATDDREQFVMASEVSRRKELLTSGQQHADNVEEEEDDDDDYEDDKVNVFFVL